MTDRAADGLGAYLDLEAWESSQPKPTDVFQVIETGDLRLIGAYILREFRVATRMAVKENERVLELREMAYLAFPVADDAEGFLRRPSLQLEGRSPLQAAVQSSVGRDTAIFQLAPFLRGPAVRVLNRLATAWDLSTADCAKLVRATPQDVPRWREDAGTMPTAAVRCVAMLLGISRAIKRLPLPRRDGWIHWPTQEPPFYGRSPLNFMLEGGLPAMQQVRFHLDIEIQLEDAAG
jgi:hypothetical protein